MSHLRTKLRSGGLPLGLAAFSFVLALAQRPGTAVADTKIDLHVDPAAFLGDVASVWSSSGGLGQVQAGQYAGYLFPMAPFFWLGDVVGLAPWLVQRLWLGGVLALACWGTVRLMDVLVGRPRGAAHLVAGVLVAVNPYVLEFAGRTSVTLLGYAVLPWLLLAVYRGVREPRGWTWPAAAALLVACTGGGVNAAVTAWLLLAPVGLLLYEVLLGTVTWRGAWQFAWRALLLGVGASLWWLVPVALHGGYGVNFLPFTESPGAIWGTSSLSESFRLAGYWLSYLGTGFGLKLFPSIDTSKTLLYDAPTVIASFLIPGLAVAGYAWSRRRRYAPFLLGLLIVGLFVMVVGFPDGVPLRRAITFAYYRVEGLQFLRTTYKAGPLVALALAGLGGLAAAELHRRLRGRRAWLVATAAAGVALVVAANWPAFDGKMLDRRVAYDQVPGAWRQVARDVDRMPPATRALVLPGQLFPFYRWGGTQDPILAALTDRPVTARSTVPYSDIHAADLLYTTDNLVQQRRLVPGQLSPLLDLMSVGAVVTGSDDDRDRSGSAEPLGVAQDLRRQPGLGRPSASYGPRRRFGGVQGDLGQRGALPQVRRYGRDPARRLVRVEPVAGQTTVDGSAETLAAMAAFGALPRTGALAYAGDRTPAEVRRAARAGGAVVIGDGNRRRVFTAARARQDHGATVRAGDPFSIDAALLNPFPDRGSDAQTVALVRGARSVRAPYSPTFPQFPEHRPVAAFDGDPVTYWVADRYLARERRYIDIDFGRPVRVDRLDLLPKRESNTDLTEVEIAAKRYPLHRGWNRLRPGLGRVRGLRVRVTAVKAPNQLQAGPGAIAEIRIPGVRVRDRLRPPRLAERALRGADLRRSALTYLFSRTTGDDPYRRSRRPDPARGYVPITRNLDAALVSDPGDGETAIERTIDPPATRSYDLAAWVSVAPGASDAALDRLAGYRGPVRVTSSARWQSRPRYRGSAAFDGRAGSAWVAPLRSPRASLSWSLPRPVTVRRLTLGRPPVGARAPAAVRLSWEGGRTGVLAVGDGGSVRLPRPARGRDFRLQVVRARPPGPRQDRDAVGIAELRGAGVPEVRAAGGDRVRSSCAAISIRARGASRGMRFTGARADFEAGRPLRAEGCGRLTLPAGRQDVSVRSQVARVDLLELRSPAPEPVAATGPTGSVTDYGSEGRGRRDGVRVAVTGPSWLVLGESYSRGWRAWCNDRALGEPTLIDGFANGWRVGRDCRDVRFAYAPNRVAAWSYLLALPIVAVLLVLVVLGLRRRRPGWPVPAQLPDPPVARWPLRRALAAGVVLVPVAAFLFAIRAGVLIGPGVAFVLWRGLGPGVLSAAAGLLVGVAAPAVALLEPPVDLGGFNSEYATDLVGAHWLALAAFVALAVALWRGLSTASGANRGQAGERPTAP